MMALAFLPLSFPSALRRVSGLACGEYFFLEGFGRCDD